MTSYGDHPPAGGGPGRDPAPPAAPVTPGPVPPPGPAHGPVGATGPGGHGGQGGAPALMTAHRPGIVPLRPLFLGDILDGAVKAVRHNPKAMIGLSLLVNAIFLVPSALLSLLLERRLADGVDAGSDLAGFSLAPVHAQRRRLRPARHPHPHRPAGARGGRGRPGPSPLHRRGLAGGPRPAAHAGRGEPPRRAGHARRRGAAADPRHRAAGAAPSRSRRRAARPGRSRGARRHRLGHGRARAWPGRPWCSRDSPSPAACAARSP